MNSDQWSEIIGQDEIRMIRGVFEVSELQVRDIMIPRSNMIVLDTNSSITDLLHQIGNSGHSRFPVIGENKDEVVGILLAKDLLKFSNQNDNSDFKIKDFLRAPTFIPESKRLKILLNEFRKSRNHMAIVVDEYGTLMGIVTLEDIIEEIVGDIEDEYDVQIIGAKKNKDGSYNLNGNITIRDVNREFGWRLPDENASTIAGLIFYEIKTIPEPGQIFSFYGFRFEILRAKKNHIELVKATVLN